MREADAQKAVDYGVDGVVISNHGGRSMDSAPSPLEVLPSIAKAVGGQTNVIVDSGIRRGSDIVKCLALGAHAVMAGRAMLYGVGAGGEAGVSKAIAILHQELRRTMAYVGCSRIGDITAEVVWRGSERVPTPLR
jgi:isopentenyl diphosphate isomerase/L-lactate dehydrogenase-like FMN-dependent dehydrogenase